MTDWLLAHEPAIRLSVFLGVFVAVAAWEVLSPRRTLLVGRLARWPHNIGIVVLNTVVVRLLFPAALGYLPPVPGALLQEAALLRFRSLAEAKGHTRNPKKPRNPTSPRSQIRNGRVARGIRCFL